MIAKNNKTGEIVTNFGISKEFGTISYVDSTNTLRFSTASDAEWTIIEEEISFDWQSFRNQAAKDILAGIVSHNGVHISSTDTIRLTKLALEFANELVIQLKEKEEKQ